MTRTRAIPCRECKASRGTVTFDFVMTFIGEEFSQERLDELSSNPTFCSQLFATTAASEFSACGLELLAVEEGGDRVLYRVAGACDCASSVSRPVVDPGT